MLWPPPPATPGLALLEKLKLSQLCKITEKDTWPKKMIPSMEPFFDLFDFD